MTFRKTLLLAVVLAAVILYITKVELASDYEKELSAQPFQRLAPQAIEHITLSDAQGSFTLVNAAPEILNHDADNG